MLFKNVIDSLFLSKSFASESIVFLHVIDHGEGEGQVTKSGIVNQSCGLDLLHKQKDI